MTINEVAFSPQVTLRGAKDCVQGAMLRIAEMVNDLECQVTVECVIEQQHHRVLMGAKGSNIQKVCSTYDVQIKIPDRKPAAADGQEAEAANEDLQGDVHGSVKGTVPSSDIIRITGKKEKCEAAAEALRALIPVNVEVRELIIWWQMLAHARSPMFEHHVVDFRSKCLSSSTGSSLDRRELGFVS